MKNRKTTGIIAIVMLMAMSLLTSDVLAQRNKRFMQDGPRNNRFSMNENQPGRVYDQLGLTDEQKDKIETLRVVHQKEMLPLRNELREKHARLQTLKTTEPVNLNAVNKLIDEIAVLMASQMKQKTAHQQEVRALLTDEQKIKYDMYHSRGFGEGRFGRGEGRRGNGRGMGNGSGWRF